MRFALSACLVLAAVATPATGQQAALDPQAAFYELRIYYPAPGKLAALNARSHDEDVGQG